MVLEELKNEFKATNRLLRKFSFLVEEIEDLIKFFEDKKEKNETEEKMLKELYHLRKIYK